MLPGSGRGNEENNLAMDLHSYTSTLLSDYASPSS